MDAVVLECRTLKITSTYSHIVGIWPGQKKFNQYFLRTVVYIFIITALLAQIARVVCFFNMDNLTNQLFPLVTNIMALLKYGLYTVKNSEVIKYMLFPDFLLIYSNSTISIQFKVLLDGMMKDLETYKTKEELAVMMPYINRAVFLATFYTYGAVMCLVVLIQIPLLSLIADIVIPLNESRPRLYIFPVYYHFFDLDDNDYFGLIHTDIAAIVITCGSIACDTFYISTVQHACGLFAIAGYRFKAAIEDIHDIRNIAEMSNKTYKEVCRSIKAHDRAIRHVRGIDNFYDSIFFIALCITVASFSCVLLRLAKMKSSPQFYMYIVYSIIELGHLFFLTIQGQFVSNVTDSFYDDLYGGQWYNSVPKTQALFILALRAAMDPPEITAGGVIAMNLQTFAEVVKLSFSYYTVLQTA